MGINNRIEWVDIAKGIGMILVIAGHTFALEYSAPIYTFHMPLFFLLSGLFIHTNEDIRTYTFKRAKSLLLVWLIAFLICFGICLLIPSWRELITVNAIVKDLYSANTNVVQNSSLWFLICLFAAEILFWVIDNIKQKMNPYLFYSLFILYALIVLRLPSILNYLSQYVPLMDNRLPWKIDTALCATVFIAMGNWCKPYITKYISKLNIIYVIIIAICWFILTKYNGWTNMNALSYGHYRLLFYPIACIGMLWVMGLSYNIAKISGPISIFLSTYGKSSLLIFVSQSMIIRLYILFLNHLCGLDMTLYANNPMIHQIGSFIVVGFIVSPILAYIYSRLQKKA